MKEEYWDMTTINKFSSYCLKDLVKERAEHLSSRSSISFQYNINAYLEKKKKVREKSARWSKYILFLLNSGPQKWKDKILSLAIIFTKFD